MSIEESLLKLSNEEKRERAKARKDYYYFKGKCKDKDKAIGDTDKLGQSWIVADNLDYVPTQDIRNKVKNLLKKQARFMFGKAPTILFKPYNPKDKEKTEELRQFIDDILEQNGFWSDTLKAFLMSTIKKRVLLRVEANPGEEIKIKYHNIEEFNYKIIQKKLEEVSILTSETFEEDKKRYYKYTYFKKEDKCKLRTEMYEKSTDVDKPDKRKEIETGLNRIPAWLIINGGLLGEEFGESDLEELKDSQDMYNRRISDFADALRFQMFGQTVIIDADEDSVNNATIAPNALLPLKSLDREGAKADAKRVESSFSSAEAIESYLKRAEHDMHQALDMPEDEQLKEIPSAKAMKYMYNDLIARCEEKWNDWELPIKELIRFIIECNIKFNCYEDWDNSWNDLKFKIIIEHNYPIPSDEEDKKRLAMEEVNSNVRSHRSYIKDFSDDEDVDGTMKEIVEDVKVINAAETDPMIGSVGDELGE